MENLYLGHKNKDTGRSTKTKTRTREQNTELGDR